MDLYNIFKILFCNKEVAWEHNTNKCYIDKYSKDAFVVSMIPIITLIKYQFLVLDSGNDIENYYVLNNDIDADFYIQHSTILEDVLSHLNSYIREVKLNEII